MAISTIVFLVSYDMDVYHVGLDDKREFTSNI